MRDDNGRFGAGNNFGKGRPKGSGKKHVKEMTWQALERVVKLLFTMSEPELLQWLKENKSNLSRAEKVFLMDKHSQDLKHLNQLLDRIIGKPTFAMPDLDDGDDELAHALAVLEAQESGEEYENESEDDYESDPDDVLDQPSEEKPAQQKNEFIASKQKQSFGAIEHKKKLKEKRRQARKLAKDKRNGRRRK